MGDVAGVVTEPDFFNGQEIDFRNGERETLRGIVNGGLIHDDDGHVTHVPAWVPAKHNTILVAVSNIVTPLYPSSNEGKTQ